MWPGLRSEQTCCLYLPQFKRQLCRCCRRPSPPSLHCYRCWSGRFRETVIASRNSCRSLRTARFSAPSRGTSKRARGCGRYWHSSRSARTGCSLDCRSSTNVDPIEWMFSVNIWALIAAIPILVTGSISDFNEFGQGLDLDFADRSLYGSDGSRADELNAYVGVGSSLYLLGMHVVAVGAAADSR